MNIKNKVLLFILAILAFLLFSQNAPKPAVVRVSDSIEVVTIEPKVMDSRAEILARYLSKFNSPMQYHAQDFIDASDTYGLDWKMLPAIAGTESTFGKRIPGGYNAYGWAIFNRDSRFGFKSWRDGMFVVAKGLREGYINKGLTDPYSMNKIYAASPNWGKNVTFFMNDLEKFASQYQVMEKGIAPTISLPNIAAASGQLVLR